MNKETCPGCGKPREPGVRCPHCGARYEEKKPDPDDIIRAWDRLTTEQDLRKWVN